MLKLNKKVQSKRFFIGKTAIKKDFSINFLIGVFFVILAISLILDVNYVFAGTSLSGQAQKETDFFALKADEEKNYTATIKNTGSDTWKVGEVFLETGSYLQSFSSFQHKSWISYYRVIGLAQDVKSGQSATIVFKLKGPINIKETVQQNFQLVKDMQPIKGTMFRLFIEITGSNSDLATNQNIAPTNTPVTPVQKTQTQTSAQTKIQSNLAPVSPQTKTSVNTVSANINGDLVIKESIKFKSEPDIRVGLFSSFAAQRVTGDYFYDIYAGNNILLSGLAPNYVAIISFDKKTKKYAVSTTGATKYTTDFIRIVPRRKEAVMTLLDFENRPAWNTSLNDNKYRNALEFRYSSEKDKLWVINELPIDSYLKGLAETTNYSPVEYQKVMATAARTYALYHLNQGIIYNIASASTKHSAENYHIDATYDQVYKGYGSEQRLTKLCQAIDETEGVAVVYQDEIVVTPYFSQSNGKTKAWTEVWSGADKPWLQSVSVPEDKGEELLGHGVGLSAWGAYKKVENGESWDKILKYFYQNTELAKVYN